MRSRLIPIELRVTVLCGIPTSIGLYGAELWGGCHKLVQKIQTLLDKGWKWILGVSDKCKVNLTCVKVEFAAKFVSARARGAVVRLYSKAMNGGLKIWLSDLVHHRYKARKRTWCPRRRSGLKPMVPSLGASVWRSVPKTCLEEHSQRLSWITPTTRSFQRRPAQVASNITTMETLLGHVVGLGGYGTSQVWDMGQLCCSSAVLGVSGLPEGYHRWVWSTMNGALLAPFVWQGSRKHSIISSFPVRFLMTFGRNT